jgi:hypothetical protein
MRESRTLTVMESEKDIARKAMFLCRIKIKKRLSVVLTMLEKTLIKKGVFVSYVA